MIHPSVVAKDKELPDIASRFSRGTANFKYNSVKNKSDLFNTNVEGRGGDWFKKLVGGASRDKK